MEQETFLGALEQQLIELDVPEQYRSQYLHQFARYLNTMSDDESLRGELAKIEPRAIALEIARAVAESVDREDAQARDAEAESGIPSDLTLDDPLPGAEEARREYTSYDDPLSTDEIAAMELTDIPEPYEEEFLDPPADSPSGEETEIPLYFDDVSAYEGCYDKEKAPLTLLYVAVVVLTAPLSLTLFAVLFALFFTLFAGIGIIIAAFAVSTVIVAGVGGAVSVFDLIYGITRFGQSSAIGLYEVGLSVMLIGATLLLSVALYQIGLHFLPWVTGRVRDLLSFIKGQIKRFYAFLRRECAER